MKIKVWNKQTSKWFSGEKDITWARKRGGDWWLVKPEDKSQSSLPSKESEASNQGFGVRDVIIAVLLGGIIGIASLFFVYIWSLIKYA